MPPESERGGLLELVVRRPVAIGMFMLALAVFGGASLLSLRQDLLPEISYPTLTVRTSWPGASPEDLEQRVSIRIAEALGTLPGLVRTSSTSRAGVSDVLLEFDWGTPMVFAVQDVREKLDGVFLPQGVERPLILRYDPNLDPILRIGVTARRGVNTPADLMHLRWLAEQRIERELESLPGVAAVLVRGGLVEEIHVRVDPGRLEALRIDPGEVARRLAQENVNASGGVVREGSTDYVVRTLNELRDPEEIAELALVRRAGATVRIRDVAEVERRHRRREVVTRIAGQEAVEIAVYREAGANIVQLAERVRETLFGSEAQKRAAEELEKLQRPPTLAERARADYLARRLSDEVELTLLSDQSVFIRDAISEVQSAAGLGALFAVAVILAFLRRLAATAIIAVAIPMSVIVTFAPMHLAGVSLNLMSLGGLALGIGMLVDNAIVVLESIARCREEGDKLARAAVRGVREVAGAVTASTLTTVSVFAPIAFVGGIAGQIFGDQALTVVTALMVSLLVAVLFIPMLAARPWLAGGDTGGEGAGDGDGDSDGRPEAGARRSLRAPFAGWSWDPLAVPGGLLTALMRSLLWLLAGLSALVGSLVFGVLWLLRWAAWPFAKVFELALTALAAGYRGALGFTLRVPLLIVLLAVGLGWDALRRVPGLGVELLPEVHQGEFTAFVQLEPGTPLEATDRLLTGIDQALRLDDRIATTALTSGVETETLSRDVEGPHTARLTVRMAEAQAGRAVEEELAESVRARFAAHPAVDSVELRRPTPFQLDAPLAIEVRGHDLELLAEVAAEVERTLRSLPELADVRSSQRRGFPELQLTFDRDKTLEFGLDLAQVTQLVRDQVLGNVATRTTRGDDRIDVRVIAPEERLASLEDVLALAVNPAAEVPVPLRAVADARLVQGPAEIRRIGNSRAVVIEATPRGLDLGGTARRVEAALGDLVVPDEVLVELGGQKREMESALRDMRFALLLAIFLVYVVMASQFESLLHPLVILLSVPLAGVGVVHALERTGTPLSVVASIGLILLAGIVVNNAIVLVDRINQNRRRGQELSTAVMEAGAARLRPILMTAATTVLGLLPLTGWLAGVPYIGQFGSGEGAELRAPLAIVVIAGLSFATVLTLIVVPAVYTLLARFDRVGREAHG